MKLTTRKNVTKVLASVVLVGGAASVAGLGTFGAFTSTTSATESVSAGRVVIDMTNQAARGLDIAATNLVPGDTIPRAVQLTRGSTTETFGSVKMSTVAGTANALSADTGNGLQVAVDQCSAAWVKAPTTNELTCSGTTDSVIARRPVIGTDLDLAVATTKLNAAGASNLRVELFLPGTAGNGFQGLSNNVTFTFDATQRSGDFK